MTSADCCDVGDVQQQGEPGLAGKKRRAFSRRVVHGFGFSERPVVFDDPGELIVQPVQIGRNESEAERRANRYQFLKEAQPLVNMGGIKLVSAKL